jgi:hypothetical protein
MLLAAFDSCAKAAGQKFAQKFLCLRKHRRSPRERKEALPRASENLKVKDKIHAPGEKPENNLCRENSSTELKVMDDK